MAAKATGEEGKGQEEEQHKFRFDIGFKFSGTLKYEYRTEYDALTDREPRWRTRTPTVEWRVVDRKVFKYKGDNKPHEAYTVECEFMKERYGRRGTLTTSRREMYEHHIDDIIRSGQRQTVLE